MKIRTIVDSPKNSGTPQRAVDGNTWQQQSVYKKAHNSI